MQASPAFRPAVVGDKVLFASRQVWLAGLGAAAVTRDWAGKEAGNVFRTLVREGSVVESRAVRYVNARLGPSVAQGNALLEGARSAVARYAGNVAALVREVPALAGLPMPGRPNAAPRRATKARRPAKAAKAATRRTTRTRRAKAR